MGEVMDDQAGSLSKHELKSLIREALREELLALGLLIEEPEHVIEARDDFRFLRRLRKAQELIAARIGNVIVITLMAGTLSALWLGVKHMLARQ
jgi:hypothetical protein